MIRVARKISTIGVVAATAVTLWGTAAQAAQANSGSAPTANVSEEGHWERYWYNSWDQCNEDKRGYQLVNYWVDGCYGGIGTYYLDVHLPY
ncbi:hypothetical protein [Streptosporangium sp. NPDC000239]|uniref:Secreted protein n=1 Tax=Streptosporangium jomthongense TaxID=1193683 RepID=A0ABV8F541_9ACTN